MPLAVGTASVKWHLPSSSAAEHRGRTDRAPVREHKAIFEYSKEMPIRLTIDKNLALQSCEVHFEIIQDYNDSGRGGRVHLGNVKLNLAEYTNIPVESSSEEEGEDGMITRRYLMQDSKVNATLKVGIAMKQVDGDTNFIAPPLKSAMVVGGIAGIVQDTGDVDDMPSVASKSRELSEAQDIYRQSLAATWACKRGELSPDEVIEDVFNGGDGGGFRNPHPRWLDEHRHGSNRREGQRSPGMDDSSTSDDTDSRRTVMGQSLTPAMARDHGMGHHRHTGSGDHGSNGSTSSGVSGRGSIEQQMQHSQTGLHHQSKRKGQPDYREITEFDLRDDLKSWQISVR